MDNGQIKRKCKGIHGYGGDIFSIRYNSGCNKYKKCMGKCCCRKYRWQSFIYNRISEIATGYWGNDWYIFDNDSGMDDSIFGCMQLL